jgi:hypothetical protein
MIDREDIPLVIEPSCDYIDDEVYECCIQCYRYDICEAAWIKEQEKKENKEN